MTPLYVMSACNLALSLALAVGLLVVRRRHDPVKKTVALEKAARAAVRGAEQRYGPGNGADKARFAREAVLEHARAVNHYVSPAWVDALVHQAVAELPAAQRQTPRPNLAPLEKL